MNKSRRVFIYLHSCLDKLTIIASRKPENHLFVSDTGHYDAHVDPTFSRPYKSVKKAVTKHKIRCVEPHIIACGIEHLRKKRVAHIFVHHRGIIIRQNIAVATLALFFKALPNKVMRYHVI